MNIAFTVCYIHADINFILASQDSLHTKIPLLNFSILVDKSLF